MSEPPQWEQHVEREITQFIAQSNTYTFNVWGCGEWWRVKVATHTDSEADSTIVLDVATFITSDAAKAICPDLLTVLQKHTGDRA